MVSKDGSAAAKAAREMLTSVTQRDGYFLHNPERRLQAAQVLATLELAEAIRSLKGDSS